MKRPTERTETFTFLVQQNICEGERPKGEQKLRVPHLQDGARIGLAFQFVFPAYTSTTNITTHHQLPPPSSPSPPRPSPSALPPTADSHLVNWARLSRTERGSHRRLHRPPGFAVFALSPVGTAGKNACTATLQNRTDGTTLRQHPRTTRGKQHYGKPISLTSGTR